MPSLKQLFNQEQLGFTVYSPDCTQSRLWGNLDKKINDVTGFKPVFRQWINHDVNSIIRFYTPSTEAIPPLQDPLIGARKYEDVPIEQLQYGHLVPRLFISGASLLTCWHGDNVIETLFALKGKTQPAQADGASIRGSFWCDNGVCNLLHVSDDYIEAERELKTIQLWEHLDNAPQTLSLIAPISAPTSYIAHSGIAVFCHAVNRLLAITPDMSAFDIQLPPSGIAKETNDYFTELLQQMAAITNPTLTQTIEDYLVGDVVAVTQALKQMPVSKWEHLVIQCGAITRDTWNKN